MSRSAKPRAIGPKAWLLGLLFVVGGLLALFSLKPADLLPKEWPLRISPAEVQRYAELFDRRPVEMGTAKIMEYRFGASSESPNTCITEHTEPGWIKRSFTTEGYTDSVDIRHVSDRAGFEVRFKKDKRFKGQRRMYLLPSAVGDMQSAYLEMLATELGLITPAVTYVHVRGCEDDPVPYRVEERVDDDFLERRGLTNALRVSTKLDPTHPDDQFAKVHGNAEERAQLRGIIERAIEDAQDGNNEALSKLVDEDAAISWLIMAWIDGRELRDEKIVLAYQWTTGKLKPIYRAPRREWQFYAEDDAPLAPNVLTPLLADPQFKERFKIKLAELQQRLPELRGNFATLDLTWLPVLAEASALPFAKTTAMQAQYKLLDRRLAKEGAAEHLHRAAYFPPGHATFLHGMFVPTAPAPVADQGEVITALAKLYKLRQEGDTLVFPRGKYMIDEDLILPQGKAVMLLEGARLFVAKGKSIVVNGAFHVRGTLRNPVFIRPMMNDAFGTIAMLGDGSQRCNIRGLMISGGSGATVNGVKFSGMVSVHGAANTTVVNSVINTEAGEIALHIDGGQVKVEGIRFEGGAKAQLLIDRANGMISDCSFLQHTPSRRGSKPDTTTLSADAIALNACKMAVSRTRVTGMLGAGIAVDAASQVLVRGGRFERNAIAITAADLSKVHVEGNSFVGNAVVFRAYRDRTQSGATILVYPNEFIDNEKEQELGEASEITRVVVFDQKIMALFGLPMEPAPVVRRGGR